MASASRDGIALGKGAGRHRLKSRTSITARGGTGLEGWPGSLLLGAAMFGKRPNGDGAASRASHQRWQTVGAECRAAHLLRAHLRQSARL